ncbi:hypothetical protein LCM27_15025 [Ruegeria marisrubri]|uniref:hypothetical protein n=1 Tax=Ruegeria marisrubri TaxID=1685379 RepID=UPI001CD22470|nr:hypothetical protein [Ruegeria marisrubri]MCA0907713.1 hypothetical protein [Ruegeria marisrubri]
MPVEPENDQAFEALRATLSDFQIEGVEYAFAEMAERLLLKHRDELIAATRPEPISEAEREALQSVGVDPGVAVKDLSPALNAIAMHAALVATAIPVREAASRLGISPSRLRQRLKERSLLGVRLADGRSWGIPAFQFTSDGEVPGLREVLREMRSDLSPVQVFAFFTTPQPDLENDNGNPMTPLRWLLAGQDPDNVSFCAREI